MGIELDVLVGHPEHELLFVATQVARAAGLKDPTSSVAKSRYRQRIGQQLKEILSGFETEQWPVFPIVGANRQGLRKDVVILKESEVYDFLIHSRAPQTLPFRKWVTEEVLPSIRKTGRYDASESTDPIAAGIMDELKLLRGELVELKGTICSICGFHDTWTLSPRSFGHSFHAHLDT
ncbi:MAG: BRO family protein [Roseomonas mucosa]|nr:BRO family protein [Roseomonas mucosa]